MGYQIVASGNSRHLILNATLTFPLEGRPRRPDQGSRPSKEFDWPQDQLRRCGIEGASPVELLQRLSEVLEGEEPLEIDEPTVQTHGSYPSQSRQGETFVRYSAFRRDLRIDPTDGSVRAGTYVTTATDAPHVPSGLAAVGRYALPNPTPAVHAFTLTPAQGVAITCGATAPRFGQAGGGVEVLFINSLPAGTAMGPVLIPER